MSDLRWWEMPEYDRDVLMNYSPARPRRVRRVSLKTEPRMVKGKYGVPKLVLHPVHPHTSVRIYGSLPLA